MHYVRIKRNELLDTVIKNREIHSKEYTKALDDRLLVIEETLRSLHYDLVNHVDIPESVDFPLPQSFLSEYDKIIKMIEMEVREEIEITHDQFKQWVMDDWQWTSMFKSLTSTYSG